MGGSDGIRARLRAYVARNPALGHIATLFSGMALSQVAVLAISVVLARIYTAEEFGQFAIYMSVTSVIVMVAALRFDMTVMLPKEDDHARVIGRLARRSIVVFAVASSLLALVFRDQIAELFGGDSELGMWMMLSGITVFLVADSTLMQYWLNRMLEYRAIAVNRAQQVVGSSLGQLVLGLAGVRGLAGLLIGAVAGQLLAWLRLWRGSMRMRKEPGPGAPKISQMLRRYRKMPLLNGPNAILDALRVNGINLLIGAVAVASLGQFNLAWRVLQVPIALLNAAVSQVFYQRLTTIEPGRMTPLLRYVLVRAALVGLAPFVLLYFAAPWLFVFIFGDQWADAGNFARAMTPWMFFQLLSSPTYSVFIVTETQSWLLAFSAALTVLPLAFLTASTSDMIATIEGLSLLMAVLLAMQIGLSFIASRRFDRRASKS